MTKTRTSTSHLDSDLNRTLRQLKTLDWARIAADLDGNGYAVIGPLFSPDQCTELAQSFDTDTHFRNRVVMERHGYGRGEYRYFAYPLPPLIQTLRTSLYASLAPIANRWNAELGVDVRYPGEHTTFLDRCHAAGQSRPTPLLLRYGIDDFNCLHQDLYGEHVFPLQIACLLGRPGLDFTGGEFVLTEQRPRMQSRVEVVPLQQGEGVIFPVRQRPVRGVRGSYRVNMKHGVSRLRSGNRHTLGFIFHDAT